MSSNNTQNTQSTAVQPWWRTDIARLDRKTKPRSHWNRRRCSSCLINRLQRVYHLETTLGLGCDDANDQGGGEKAALEIYKDHLCRGVVPELGWDKTVIREITGKRDPDDMCYGPSPESACALLYFIRHKMNLVKRRHILRRLARWRDTENGYSLLDWCVVNFERNPGMFKEAMWCLINLAGMKLTPETLCLACEHNCKAAVEELIPEGGGSTLTSE